MAWLDAIARGVDLMLLVLHQNLGGGTTFFQTISATAIGTAGISTAIIYPQTIAATATGTASIAEVFIAGSGPAKVIQLVRGVVRKLVRGVARSIMRRDDQ